MPDHDFLFIKNIKARFKKIENKSGLHVGIESLIEVHPVVASSADKSNDKLTIAKKNIKRFHGISDKILNHKQCIFLALRKPLKDLSNESQIFTHIPLDTFFFNFDEL